MKVLLINSVCGIGSTGRICLDIAENFEQNGADVKIAYGREKRVSERAKKYAVRIGNSWDVFLHVLYTRITDKHGLASKGATRHFLKWATEYDPDILWLHNIHGYYINYEMLFKWIKSRPDMKVKWTLHDCWAFTGHCAYFSMSGCEKWKQGCFNCPSFKEYPQSKLLDNCSDNFYRKKKSFSGVDNMQIITPSKWLAKLTRNSFLNEYSVEVNYNSIDHEVFKPRMSDLKEKWGISADKIVVLGVANQWTERKGLKDLVTLSKILNNNFIVILVGVNSKQIKDISREGIISKTKTPVTVSLEENNSSEVVEIKRQYQSNELKHDKIEECGGNYVITPGVCNIMRAIVSAEQKKIRCGVGELMVDNGKSWIIGSGTDCILIEKTDNVEELTKIYTIADYFINPTYEDNLPTVNLEAKACGAVVITYDTGGCAETLLL